MTKRSLPLLIGAVTVVVVALMYVFRSQPVEREREVVAPLVRTIAAEPAPFQFRVRAHGTVAPRSQSELIPQVSGEVVWVSPSLVVGGFFDKGEVLVRIDPADYEADLESARASVARAQSEHRRAKKELGRQRRLADRSVASQSRIDDAENFFRVADASLRESRAKLGRAERDLARTELHGPYHGRVRSEGIDVGQFVMRGNPVASLYAVDFVEVRLPLPDRELAFLDLPLEGPRNAVRAEAAAAPSDETAAAAPDAEGAPEVAPPESGKAEPVVPEPEEGPLTLLHADFAGARHTWEGRVVRTEGELDPKTRMVHVVARFADPYGAAGDAEPDIVARPPLAVGLFVEAEILGRRVEKATLLPRIALREGRRVYVVDAEGRLRFRDVEVLREERGRVVIGEGLRAGERVCVSPLSAALDGMRVRVSEEPAAPAEASR